MSGGLFGTGGGLLGSLLGAVLAPETFGLSIPLGAAIGGGLGGVGGNLLGDAITHTPVDPLGLIGSGLGGAAGGYGLGSSGILGGAGGIFDATGGAGPAFLGGSGSLGAPASGLGGTSAAAAASPFGNEALTGATSALPTSISGGVGTGSLAGGAGADTLAGGASSVPALVGGTADFTAPGNLGSALALGAGGSPAGALGAGQLAPGLQNLTGGSGLFGPGGVLGDVGSWIGRNKDLIGGGLIASNIGKQLLSPPTIPGQGNLDASTILAHNLAGELAGRASAGSALTPEQQASANATLQGQIAAIKAHYAQLGMSGSSAEQTDIAQAQNRALGNQAGIQTQNAELSNQQASTALQAVNAANAPTIAIANQQLSQDQQLSDAIAQMAAAALFTQ